jgi:hypothetical protein
LGKTTSGLNLSWRSSPRCALRSNERWWRLDADVRLQSRCW